MPSSLMDVRETILGQWQPSVWHLAESERANASQLLEELRRVSDAGAWRSTALLAGQLAEACLRAKLVDAGVNRLKVQTLRTFSVVIREARNHGLLQGRGGSAGGDSVKSAIDLRNESSHFALWKTYTPEREATWALVLAALILGDLGFGIGSGVGKGSKAWLDATAKSLDPSVITGPLWSATLRRSLTAPSRPSGAVGYTVSDIRTSILTRWQAPTAALNEDEKAGTAALLDELKLVAECGAWRAQTSLSGQMVEGYLKSRIVQAGKANRDVVEGMTLKPLIRRCKTESLFARPQGRTTTGADAVHSAEILRNWASHYAFWLPYTDELRAAQALALVITVLESLYPEPTPGFSSPPSPITPQWVATNWKSFAPGSLLNFLETVPSPPSPFNWPTQEVFDHIVRLGALSTFGKMLQWAKKTSLPQEDLRAAVHLCFSDLLRRAHRESLRRLMDAVFQLNGLFRAGISDEPAAHALVFGALLPVDTASLSEVFRFPTSRIPLYFALARKSGDNVLAQGLRCDQRPCPGNLCTSVRCRVLIPDFWAEFDPSKNENPLNMTNALIHMPDDVKVDFLTRIPSDFLNSGGRRPFFDWIERHRARNSVNLLGSLTKDVLNLDAKGQLSGFRQGVVVAVTTAVANDLPTELGMLPFRLHRMRLAGDDGAKAVLEAILRRTEIQDFNGGHTLRILWDSYQYFPSLARRAAAAAGTVLDRSLVPLWDAVCIAGMLELDSAGSCTRRWATLAWDEEELERGLERNVSRWIKLLAILASFRRADVLNSNVPDLVGNAARNLLSDIEIRVSAPPASVALVAQVRSLVKG